MNYSTNPIADIKFSGLHWIEASAGSGKTFTLSALMCRVLLESHLPSEVVATTFTRAATAELKARIRSRLIDVSRSFEKRREFTPEQNLAYAEEIKSSDVLFSTLLVKFASQVSYACERAKLVIDQLDLLFVGTLDSFSQKLLREFAFESGKIDRVEVTDNSKKYTHQIVHDTLRAWIEQQPLHIVELLYGSGALKSPEQYIKIVEDSLNFGSAELKQPGMPKIETQQIIDSAAHLKDFDASRFFEYSHVNGAHFATVSGSIFRPTGKFSLIFDQAIPELLEIIERGDIGAIFGKGFDANFSVLKSLAKNFRSEKIFTGKCAADAKERFYADAELHAIVAIVEQLIALESEIGNLEAMLKYHLCVAAKEQLPAMLQGLSQTTFSQQIKTLLDALQGSNGEYFAEAVHEKYKVIIVDEFQDTNQDQDNALALIWRNKARLDKGCMIMVGDRKQAIYGFRGGDMLTFVNAHADVTRKKGCFYNLAHNHRSIPELVEVVDALFQQNPNFGDGVTYMPVTAGGREHPALIQGGVRNPHPLRWVSIKKGVDPHMQMAQQVIGLLKEAQAGELLIESGEDANPVSEEDIAIIAKSNEDLDKIQYELERSGVSVNRPSKRSVFDGATANDVAAIFSAIMSPFDEQKVRRAILSPMIGENLNSIAKLEAATDGLGKYIAEFSTIREIWLERGFLSAWQYLFDTFTVWQRVITSNGKESERVVVNLRHISEILAQQATNFSGAQALFQWFLRQVTNPSQREWEMERPLSSDSGVKLMTIHKSKGLEFKIVLLFKADSLLRDSFKTLNYSTKTVVDPKSKVEIQKRVIGVGTKDSYEQEELDQHKLRIEAENRREWYVALTRAVNRMYVFMHDEKGTSLSGVGYWKNASGFDHAYASHQPLLEGIQKYESAASMGLEVHGVDMPDKRFYPKQLSSFSELLQHLKPHEVQDFLVQNHTPLLIEDESHKSVFAYTETADLPKINLNFPKGTVAGTYLHEVLDFVDLTSIESSGADIVKRMKNNYPIVFNQVLEKYDMDTQQLQEAMTTWFKDITEANIHDGFKLNTLKPKTYLSEMPFCMSMQDQYFDTSKIHDLLKFHGITIPQINRAEAVRYLVGTIDLVYQHQGMFYVADYKSNFLGASYRDYATEDLHKSMGQNSYYLQAIIYAVALHRYLKTRLSNYSISEHLGGSTYLFLRGMKSNHENGVFHWKPSEDLVLAMDDLLGNFQEIKCA